MAVRIVHTVSIQLHSMSSVEELELFVRTVKESGIKNPVLRMEHFAGDQREPSYTTLTASPGGR
jgi:hypothetical protein